MADLDGRLFIKRIISGQECFVPGDLHAEEWMHSVKVDKGVLLSGRTPRSPKHHSWFFALLHIVVENSDSWGDEDTLLEQLKHEVGHVRIVKNGFTGEYEAKTKSISFAAMAEEKFRKFRDRCLDVLAKHLGVDPLTLMKETDATQERRKR